MTDVAAMKAALKHYDETAEKGFLSMREKQRMIKEIMLAEHGEDFDKPKRTMTVNVAEQAVIDEWSKSLEAEVRGIRRDKFAYPSLTYSFTATGLGYVLTVEESTTGKTLNVSDALMWYFFG